MDYSKWTDTIPNNKKVVNNEDYSLDPNKWTSTIPTKKKKNHIKKYSVTIAAFIFGLVIVSTTKNETRSLEKEIRNLEVSINKISFDLHQSSLDYEVITSPENISRLAKEYLETEFVSYKKNQIKNLSEESKNLILSEKTTEKKKFPKIKAVISKKIEQKKVELAKLEELYSKPEELPDELKSQLANKINKTKTDLQKLYKNPRESINVNKIQQWGAVQIVKAFLGIPIIPGK